VPRIWFSGPTRVRLRGGKLSTIDGPFTETKEVIGGYAILEAKSKEEAIEQARRFLRVHGYEWDLECEVRQLDGPDPRRRSVEARAAGRGAGGCERARRARSGAKPDGARHPRHPTALALDPRIKADNVVQPPRLACHTATP